MTYRTRWLMAHRLTLQSAAGRESWEVFRIVSETDRPKWIAQSIACCAPAGHGLGQQHDAAFLDGGAYRWKIPQHPFATRMHAQAWCIAMSVAREMANHCRGASHDAASWSTPNSKRLVNELRPRRTIRARASVRDLMFKVVNDSVPPRR